MTTFISQNLAQWLEQHADSLDQSNQYADELLPKLAQDGVFKQGVPATLGGNGNDLQAAINTITEIARYSLTAAFTAWGHRTLLENIIHSQSAYHQQFIPDLLSGKRAAGTGLSNAVKFTSGIEELNVTIREENGKYYLSGRLPWVTNLSQKSYLVIFVASYENNEKPPVTLCVPSEAGLILQPELPLVALKGSHTHPVLFDNIPLNPDWIIGESAVDYLSNIRPNFLGLQFGMAFGLAQKSLSEVEKTLESNRTVLETEWKQTKLALEKIEQELKDGLQTNRFHQDVKALFQLRIDIVGVVTNALLLELQAGGGRAYLENTTQGFIRRWRELAFLPIVSPSAVQLRLVLSKFN